MQISFSRLWDGFASDAEAKAARDAEYRRRKENGESVRRWVLKNQRRDYQSFGVPDGRSCDVYMLNIG